MKATRFMRKPFFVDGFEVTDENMDALAKWCGGYVIKEDGAPPFVLVPVLSPTHERQTKGYVGTWIVVSVQRGKKSYKVYDQDWLFGSFLEIDDDLGANHISDSTPRVVGETTRRLPVQSSNRTTPTPSTAIRPRSQHNPR